METRRQIKMDLITHLREDWLLQRGLFRNRTNIVLSAETLQDKRIVYKNPQYFNWVYNVPTGVVANYPPVIRDAGGIIDDTNYFINLRRGEVNFTGTYNPIPPVTADFATMHFVVSETLDELYDLSDSPFSYISIQRLTIREEGLQLGGGVYQNCDFALEVGSYTRNAAYARARTDEAVGIIKRGLNCIPLVDYSISFPLDSNGDREAVYDRDVQITADGTQDPCIYQLIEQSVVDTDIPNFGDSREYARAVITFTLMATADTTDTCP